MRLEEVILSNHDIFKSICQQYGVKSLYAFGSSITDKFNNETSDIDLLVEVDANDPIEKGEALMSLWDSLEVFFQRKVDLLTNESLTNPILRSSIDSTKKLIYDGTDEKVLV
ncbi:MULTISPECIES: nucleotidyltransferase family protein [Reichenbachiella]|uniref:nucleotidyltransferase family protein n=1 Tax=Reichenbachiella TaxID=156993 RepID=UPI000C1461A3|nr:MULTISPECIES: nucleotidyltransferase domain-containing protein [Reichenbachiella]MBU2912689.1 nucleotidyltransferase domain-containing protein [Reichenbachiella agariperforans]PIB35622.1 DNA polymerase subunit beta [Reichenbachiella sp. 5M10]